MKAFMLISLIAALAICPGMLLGKTIYVDDDAPGDPGPGNPAVSDPLEDGTAAHPFDAIQEGINAAVDTDTVLVLDGTYTGDGNRDLDFGGRAITVRSQNGAETCIIDCEGTEADPHRGFFFHSGEGLDSVLEGFTITNGWIESEHGHGGGAAISAFLSSPTIRGCIMRGNIVSGGSGGFGSAIFCLTSDAVITACTITGNEVTGMYFGGGIGCHDSHPLIEDCTISGNRGPEGGGILIWEGEATITGCAITDNVAVESYPGGGGVRIAASTATITDCLIARNSTEDPDAAGGGGICCGYNTSIVVSGCTIMGNEAGSGGGLYVPSYGGGVTEIRNCTIIGNRAEEGGGVDAHGSGVSIANCIITGNEASTIGGGLSLSGPGAPSITNCTVTANRALLRGGGLYCTTVGEQLVANSIVWGNAAPEGHEIAAAPTSYSSILVLRYCDVQGGAADVYVGEGYALDYDASNIEADPLARPDGHLLSGSPCIDWCPDGPADDVDGEMRPFGSAYDIGADEFIDTDGDGLPDWWELAYFGSPTAARPWRDADHDWAWNITEYEWALDPLDADTDDDGRRDGWELGQGTNPLHPDTRERTYYVNGMTGDDAWDGLAPSYDGTHGPKATIQAGIDATLTGWGYTVLVADGTYTGDGNRDLDFGGKAIVVRSVNGAEATIINCEGTSADVHRGFDFHWGETAASVLEGFTITNGYAPTYYYYEDGGGIRIVESSPTIQYCIIDGNTANEGGGIYCSDSSASISNCTIRNNVAASGGGIDSEGSGRVTVSDCTVTGNEADYGGGFCGSNAMTISDCTIGENTARLGGGIECYGDILVADCDVSGNTAEYGGGVHCGDDGEIVNCTIADNEAYYGGGVYYAGTATVRNCRIVRNSAAPAAPSYGGDGGGVYCRDDGSVLSNCFVSENTARIGGGVYSRGPGSVVVNCLVSNNTAEIGAGVACFDDPAILNCTITANTASETAGGLRVQGMSDPVATNCILWSNEPEEISVDNYKASLTITYSDVQGGWPGEGNIDMDPMLSADGHLLAGSPCIDWCPSGAADDIDGDARPVEVLGVGYDWWYAYDIGADEYGTDADGDGMLDEWEIANKLNPHDARDATLDADGDGLLNDEECAIGSDPRRRWSPTFIYVDDDAAGNPVQDGSWKHPYEAIQLAVDAAAAPAVVKVRPGTYVETVVIPQGVWVVGSGADVTTINSGDAGHAVEFVDAGAGLLAGFAVAAGGPTYHALRTTGLSWPRIRNCTFTASRSGMALAGDRAPRVFDCLIAGNAYQGIFTGGTAAPTITNCTIAGNGANGVVAWGSGTITLTNSIVWGNADDINGNPLRFAASYCDIGDGDFAGTDGNISTDPLFVNPAAGDYRLAASSPCIDAGTSDHAPSLDLVGARRWDVRWIPNTGGGAMPWYDIGAYEFRPGWGWGHFPPARRR